MPTWSDLVQLVKIISRYLDILSPKVDDDSKVTKKFREEAKAKAASALLIVTGKLRESGKVSSDLCDEMFLWPLVEDNTIPLIGFRGKSVVYNYKTVSVVSMDMLVKNLYSSFRMEA